MLAPQDPHRTVHDMAAEKPFSFDAARRQGPAMDPDAFSDHLTGGVPACWGLKREAYPMTATPSRPEGTELGNGAERLRRTMAAGPVPVCRGLKRGVRATRGLDESPDLARCPAEVPGWCGASGREVGAAARVSVSLCRNPRSQPSP